RLIVRGHYLYGDARGPVPGRAVVNSRIRRGAVRQLGRYSPRSAVPLAGCTPGAASIPVALWRLPLPDTSLRVVASNAALDHFADTSPRVVLSNAALDRFGRASVCV